MLAKTQRTMQYVWRLYVAPTAGTVLSAVYSTGLFLSSLTSYIYPARLTLEESIEQLLSVRESVRTREHQLREDITQHERRARECVETTLMREARMSIKFKLIYGPIGQSSIRHRTIFLKRLIQGLVF